MSYEFIVFNKSEGVAELVMNRPGRFNAVNSEMMGEMVDVVTRCYSDEEIRSLIITGTGPAFSAGGDVKAMYEILDGDRSAYFRTLILALNGFIASLQRLPKPVVGAINGVAAGAGVGCALACDVVIASEKAQFTGAYTGIGLSPDAGYTYFLPRLIGTKRTLELLLTNRILDAKTALELGIVNRVVPHDDLLREARETAKTLAQGPTRAFGESKVLINLGGAEPLETQLERERQMLSELSTTEDFEEGVRAFVEKRAPVFRGR